MNFTAFTDILPSVNYMVGASVTEYFAQADIAGKVIIFILLFMSVIAWGIMFCKNADLSAMDGLNSITEQKVIKASTLIEAAGNKSLKGPFAVILRDAVAAWGRTGIGNETPEARNLRSAFVENAMSRAMAKQIIKYESKMSWLGTITSAAPFLALLGTVWGVMESFGSMGGQTSVTLQQLAPGVAAALLTTCTGLIVAIPALFGYNYLSTKITHMSVKLEGFVTLIADAIDMESRSKEAPRAPEKPKPVIKETVGVLKNEPRVINFSLEDDEQNSPVPPRDFDE